MATQLTYTASGIVFARATEQNLKIAATPTGAGALDQVVQPVTFATGKITATNASVSITGTDTAFLSEFAVGDYLFYYNQTGDPVLVGKIATISNDVSLTLATAFPGSTVSGKNCGMMNVVAGGLDNFIIRIPTQVDTGTKTCIIPNWSKFVSPFAKNIDNIGNIFPANLNLQQYSNINSPQVAANPAVNISATLSPIRAEWADNVKQLFPSTESFPQFCYALINPYGNSATQLPSNTLFKLFANQSFDLNGVQVSVNEDPNNLGPYGYPL